MNQKICHLDILSNTLWAGKQYDEKKFGAQVNTHPKYMGMEYMFSSANLIIELKRFIIKTALNTTTEKKP